MTIRLLPVKSSAPATTTRMRPSEKVTPAMSRVAPKGRSAVPAVAVVAKIAPRAMKAPARTASASVAGVESPAFVTPTSSAFLAMSCGGSASSPICVNEPSIPPVSVHRTPFHRHPRRAGSACGDLRSE